MQKIIYINKKKLRKYNENPFAGLSQFLICPYDRNHKNPLERFKIDFSTFVAIYKK